MSWLNGLDAGDEVGVSYRHGVRLERVTKVTPTQVVTGRDRWRKKDGRRVGEYDRWFPPRLVEATEEVRAEVRLRNLRSRAHVLCTRGAIEKMSEADLLRVIAIFKAAEGGE